MDTMKLNPRHTTELANMSFPLTMVNGQTAGCMIGAGTSAAPVDCSTTASMKFNSIYTKSSAVSGDSRNTYLRHYLAGASGGGECLRAYTEISGVAASTAHGAHLSLGMGESTTGGAVTGLGVAVRCTLGLPDVALASGGTYAAVMAEIYSFGDASDAGAVTELSFIRVVNAGTTDGKADVDDDAFALSFQGFTAATGNMIQTGNTQAGAVAGTVKVKVGSTTGYLTYYDAEATTT